MSSAAITLPHRFCCRRIPALTEPFRRFLRIRCQCRVAIATAFSENPSGGQPHG